MEEKKVNKEETEFNGEMKPVESKSSIFLYFVGMIFVFIVLLIIQTQVASFLTGSIDYAKYGKDFVFEALWAGIVLVILLLFKNKYIFTQKRESFGTSFHYILPLFILSCVFFLASIGNIVNSDGPVDIFAIINLALLCFFVGITEEFLCRGWLLNEFLERYSDTKKGIILSILFSSLIFGFTHFMNIGDTQGFIDTVVQVLNATAVGTFFALVYYKTKNIWLVVLSHSLWDFTLMLSENKELVDCYVGGKATPAIIAYNIVSGLVLVGAYLFLCFWMYRKTDLYDKKDKKPANFLAVIGVVIYLSVLLLLPEPADMDKYRICPVYENKEFPSEYVRSYSRISEYSLKSVNEEINETVEEKPNEYDFTLVANGKSDEIEFRNNKTNSKVTLSNTYEDYLLIENKNNYIIVILVDYNNILYGSFSKNEISDKNSYLTDVKNGLKKFYVPEVYQIQTLKEKNSEYSSAIVITELREFLFFDTDGKLYVFKES